MTDGDKAECREIAREIVKEVLKEHVMSCPWGLIIVKSKVFLVGVGLGMVLFSGTAAGGAVYLVLKVFTRLGG